MNIGSYPLSFPDDLFLKYLNFSNYLVSIFILLIYKKKGVKK